MVIKTADINLIKTLFKSFSLPKPNSHKGENGKILIIGGSSLFHAASIWAAEVASYFVDIVHYSSTKENNEIITSLKKKFLNGIVIPQLELEHYINEDDVVLVGPGMMRANKAISNIKVQISNISDLSKIKDGGEYTYYLTKYLIEEFPHKKFVFDAGSLQMMSPVWLTKLKTQPIITPHQIEFERLFNIQLDNLTNEEKIQTVKETAKKYHVVILLKAVIDIISDGDTIYVVEGGNAGLTKGGTGDVLAGLCTSFFTKNNPLKAALYASILLKKTAETLFMTNGYWYNINNLIEEIPKEIKKII